MDATCTGPPLTADERALRARAADWLRAHEGVAWTVDTILPIAQREGIDFATAVLYESLLRSPRHGPFIRQVDDLTQTAAAPARSDVTFVIAPGAFYLEKPHTGADGSVIEEEATRLGCRWARVPLRSFGTLAENAAILIDWLKHCSDEDLVLVSLSKSGAEVKLALANPEAERAFRHVTVWINLSGAITGTALAGWLLRQKLRCLGIRLWFWYHGWSFQGIRELDRRPGGSLDFEIRLPQHMQAIHVVGFPLVRHLSSPLARRGHRRIAPLGPNDGAGILLGDVGRFPGLVYPVWGADHYLRPGGQNSRYIVGRLLAYLAENGHDGQDGFAHKNSKSEARNPNPKQQID